MSGVISKRQQARNEKQLHELVHTVTGNNICADCYARNPGVWRAALWRSWNIFKLTVSSMGLMECTISLRQIGPTDLTTRLTIGPHLLVGRIPLHAMRGHPPEARHPYF